MTQPQPTQQLVPTLDESIGIVGPFFWEALPSGRLVQDNPSWRAFTGQPAPLTKPGWLDSVLHPAERQMVQSAWAEALLTRKPLSITHRIRGVDGTYRRFLTQATLMTNDQDEITLLRGVTCDLSNIERAEIIEQLRATTYQLTHDAVIFTDADGIITDWNPAATDLFGFTHEEMLGQPIATLRGADDGAAMVASIIDQVRIAGEWRGELAFANKAGRHRISDSIVQALFDSEGEFIGTIGVNRDITARTANEAALEASLEHERTLRLSLEQALTTAREAEMKLRTVIDQTIIGIFVADTDHVIEANAAFLQILDYPHDSIAQHAIHWPDLTPPGWAEADAPAASDLLRFGACAPYEKEYLRSDGVAVPIILAGVLLSSRPLRIMGFVLDITERKRFETDAADRAAELEAVFEAMADSVYVYDIAGQITKTNTAARTLNPFIDDVQYRAQAFARRIHDFALTDAVGNPITPAETPVARVLRGDQIIDVETSMTLTPGKTVYLSTSGAPIRDTKAQQRGAVIVARDVTIRHQLEARTKEALNVLLRIAGIVTEPASQTDPYTLFGAISTSLVQLSGVNFAHTMLVHHDPFCLEPVISAGFTEEEETVWRTNVRAFDPANAPGLDQIIALLTDGGMFVQQFPRDTPLMTPDLVEKKHIRIAITAPVVVNQQLRGLLTIAREAIDDAALAQEFTTWDQELLAGIGHLAAEALERGRLTVELMATEASRMAAESARQRMDEFLGIASHELRTPLTSILANIQMLNRGVRRIVAAEDVSFPKQLAPMVLMFDRTEAQAHRLNRLVGDLLDISRITTGKLDLRFAECDLLALLFDAVQAQRDAWPEREIRLVAPPKQGIMVWADGDRISQVIANFLTNALKYAPPDAPIDVRLAITRLQARLSIRDRGPGLSALQQLHLFERFYRVPGIEPLSGSGVGLGLGLFICRTIIERHNGAIGVESRPGNGATFWFTLPRPESAAEPS